MSDQPHKRAAADGRLPGRVRSLAYVTTRYPAISHTFVLREVDALRSRGVDVHTVSLHRATGEHLLSAENERAARSTYAIQPPRWRELLRAHARAVFTAPVTYARTLGRSLKLARPGLRGRVWQVFYFAEAIVLWRHCARVGARHVHAHHGSPPADVALLAARFGASTGLGPATWSMTLHGPTEFCDVRWYRLAEKIRQADGVVCISDFARSQAMALIDNRDWHKLTVVHCGVIPEDYRRQAVSTAARPQLLCVGRLVPEKGQAVLLQALARMREAGRDVDLVLVGSGPDLANLMRVADRLGVSERVSFAGAVGQDAIARHYETATVFCSSSFSEGVPVVLMEAMACGRPVVATAIAGVRELVEHRRTGLLVSPGRADELADAICLLLDDRDLAQRLSENGRRHVASEFDVRRCAEQLDRFFARTMDDPEPERGGSRSRPSLEPSAAPVDMDASAPLAHTSSGR